MSTETLNDTGDIDSLSPEEMAYFESKGEKIEGLAPVSTPAPDEPAKEPAGKVEDAPKTEDMEPGEIRINAEGKAVDAKGRYVPHQALHSERERRKSVEKERDTLRSKFDAWSDVILKQQKADAEAASPAAKTADPVKLIDPEQDIFGAVRQMHELLGKTQGDIRQAQEQTTQQITETRLAQTFRDDAVRFTAATPDFGNAFAFLEASRKAELTDVYGITDDKAIAEDIRDQARAIVMAAIARGKSPAETLYSMAKSRGYVKQEAAKAAPGKSDNGKTPAQEAVERIAEGQEKGVTLSGVGGSPAPALTIDQFLAMSESEIEAYSKTPKGKAEIRKLAGAH